MSKLHVLSASAVCLAALVGTMPMASAAPQPAAPEGAATQLQPVKVDAARVTPPTRFDVSDVRSSGGPKDYRPYLRRAMHKLDCGSAPAQGQDVAFLLVIRDPDGDESQQQHFALMQE